MAKTKSKTKSVRITFTTTKEGLMDAEKHRVSLIPVLPRATFARCMFETGIMATANEAKKGAAK